MIGDSILSPLVSHLNPRRTLDAPFDMHLSPRRQQLLYFAACLLVVISASYATTAIGNASTFALLLLLFVAMSQFYSAESAPLGKSASKIIQRHEHVQDHDVTLNGREELFRRVFDSAAGMALVGSDGHWVSVNQSLCSILGYSNEELFRTSLHDLAHPDDIGPTLVQIEKLLEGNIQTHTTELRFTHKLGHNVWMLLNLSAVQTGEGNEVSHLVLQFQDITDRKMEEERLVHSVFHDALTGLPNRALFMDRLRFATERARRRKGQLFAVLFLDLDGFKTINDSMGHIMGDQLLIEVSRRLKGCLRTTDTIARLGGDEFTILLEDLAHEDESIRVVERLQTELARPLKLGARDIQITASIGVTSSTLKYERPEEVLRDADVAMYRAKSAGKARYQIFDRDQHTSQAQMVRGVEVEAAAENDELLLHYQPIVSLETGKLSAFEALVRWQHPALGLISPNEFIPIAEDSGSIATVGTWVLREACLQLKKWQSRFPFNPSLTLTVNLSGKQLIQPNLIDQVIETLRDTQVDPRNLKIEITETTLMENMATASALLQQLRALGIEIGVDDFGTGYSSLSYLHCLPVDFLKIDKSFVNSMVEKRDHAEIVKTILSLARGLGIRVVAEGVETLEQLVELRRLQCDAAQGFLFSKPVDDKTVETLLTNRNYWQDLISSLELQTNLRSRAPEVSRDSPEPVQQRRLLRAV